ncbi:3999_t:CDS:1, partial [Gigaspora rosea]
FSHYYKTSCHECVLYDPIAMIASIASSTKQATQRLYRELRLIVNKQDTASNDL